MTKSQDSERKLAMVRPQQSNNVLKLRRLANELRTADWPDEEPTNPVIVNIHNPPPKPTVPPDLPTKALTEASRTILGLRSWPQVVALATLAITVAAVAVTYLLTR